MNVLSLFDGMSCAQIALNRAGVNYDKYYASEVDKFAIKVTQENYPETIQFGDVSGINGNELPPISLLIGGSPCQGFSVQGKGLGFNDPRSKLFFEYVRLLRECNPKYFLLENVSMKKEWRDIISENLGVEPIHINSALVSAQNRVRYYWTNIPNVTQPKDRGVLLRDILEDGLVVSEMTKKGKAHPITKQYYTAIPKDSVEKRRKTMVGVPVTRSHGTYTERGDKSTCIDANYWKGPDNHGARTFVLKQVGIANIKGYDAQKRVYSVDGKSPVLTSSLGGNKEKKIAVDSIHWRKLTPIECERLQTVPDNYTAGVSNTQRYKMIGNGFTVDVIAHILKGIGNEKRTSLSI